MKMRYSTLVARYLIVLMTIGAVFCAGLYVAGVVPGGASSVVSASADKAIGGTVKVRIKPKGARQDGGQWRIDNDSTWRNHNDSVFVTEGFHTVYFKKIAGWKKPKAKLVEATIGSTTKVKGRYKVRP